MTSFGRSCLLFFLGGILLQLANAGPCPCLSGEKCLFGTHCVIDVKCPQWVKFGAGPPPEPCDIPVDPNNLPPHPIESWFTKEVFDELFPKANLGQGPHKCLPYSYESFRIALRYFPNFANEVASERYSARESALRDIAAFMAHAVQETGENDISLYRYLKSKELADACFFRGGMFNWFERGPAPTFFYPLSKGYMPDDGYGCSQEGRLCVESPSLNYWYPCGDRIPDSRGYYSSCYFGRGPVQLSYNYNYGQFQKFLRRNNVEVDLLLEPNLVVTKIDPPLALMASLWFYMTPQPPKPAMHDIVMGHWNGGDENKRAGYSGPIFGPTSLIINNECGGEDVTDPGGPGENRRIKAFKWFMEYFNVPLEEEKFLSCQGMPVKFTSQVQWLSWQPEWRTTWKSERCQCTPAIYAGEAYYYQRDKYPERFQAENDVTEEECIVSIYANPPMYGMTNETNNCLNFGTAKDYAAAANFAQNQQAVFEKVTPSPRRTTTATEKDKLENDEDRQENVVTTTTGIVTTKPEKETSTAENESEDEKDEKSRDILTSTEKEEVKKAEESDGEGEKSGTSTASQEEDLTDEEFKMKPFISDRIKGNNSTESSSSKSNHRLCFHLLAFSTCIVLLYHGFNI